MVEFSPSDFVPLAQFSLAWRWTDAKYALLPDADVLHIRALTSTAATALAAHARALCEPRRVVEHVTTIDAGSDRVAFVCERLRALAVPPEAEVVVSWDARTAVVTRWRVFVQHWREFCYPSSDDVTVWAPGEPWALCYRHFEVFSFTTTALNGRGDR